MYKRIIIAVFLLLPFATVQAESGKGQKKIQWLTFEQAMEKMKKEPRKIIVDVYTDWCGYCKKMDRETFSNPKVVEYVNKYYYAVKFNSEKTFHPITYKGIEFKYVKEGRKGVHELATALLNNRLSYPTMVYINEKNEIISPVPGYMPADDFYALLHFIKDDHFKTGNFQDFLKTFPQ
ncbi:MAG: thioredoxin fold domain-containing protein [Cytophagales bacterium]|nr:thioredoxin fold domain-containing protein [Cytophagales bacterium]